MNVRATVNLPGGSPSDPAFVAGTTREVNGRSPYIQRLLDAGYIVEVEGSRPKARKQQEKR